MSAESLSHTTLDRQTTPTWIIFRHYFIAFLLSILCTVLVLRLQHLDWISIPFSYTGDKSHFTGDSTYFAMTMKSVISTGWYLTDPSIGVPDGHFLGDFPTPEGLNYLLIKLISLFSSNWVVVSNVFFLIGFPLITLSALFVLRRLGLCYPFALSASLLYSFLPFHLIRGAAHPFLTGYYIPPLAIWLAILVYQNTLFEKKRLLLYSFICLLIGSNGVYCAYFGGIFILLGGLIGSYRRSQWRPLKYALLFITVIAFSIVVNILPTITYQLKHGVNRDAFPRSPIESEIYGLKIAQLLLPVDHDRLFSNLKHRYNTQSIPGYPFNTINENTTVTLGLIGSLGFLILIGRVFFRKKESSEDYVMDALAHFNLSAVLLATIGGFSSLIAFFLFAGTRSYNRISVFIGFFVLAAFFLFLQKKVKNQKVIYACSILLLSVGLFNQSTKSDMLPHKIKKIARIYQGDRFFFQQIEQTLPPGSMIFQLPYLPFPEGTAHHMYSYDHFKGPLHTDALKWSFGAMRGRETDRWQKTTSQLNIPEMLQELIKKGFTGLYIDRNGFTDQAQLIETSLHQLLKTAPILDRNRSFWDLRPYAEQLINTGR